jgi:hypothetical protein
MVSNGSQLSIATAMEHLYYTKSTLEKKLFLIVRASTSKMVLNYRYLMISLHPDLNFLTVTLSNV